MNKVDVVEGETKELLVEICLTQSLKVSGGTFYTRRCSTSS